MTETIMYDAISLKWWLFALDGLLVTLMALLCFTQLVAAKAFLEIVGLVLIIASIIGAYVSAQASSRQRLGHALMTPVIGCALGVFFVIPSIRSGCWPGSSTRHLLVGALQFSAGLNGRPPARG